MQNQTPESQDNSFNFRIPRWLRSAAEGVLFWSLSVAALWLPIFFLCDATSGSAPFHFMLLSHAVGIPIGIWLFRQTSKPLQSEPNQGSAEIISFAEYVEKKTGKENKRAA